MKFAKVHLKWKASPTLSSPGVVTGRKLMIDINSGKEVSTEDIGLDAVERDIEVPENGTATITTILTDRSGKEHRSEPYVVAVGYLDTVEVDSGFSHEIGETIER